ncbi:MAG: PKD domain-containing protein [Deinococcales bacterium]
MRRKRWILPLLAALLATVLVACGTGAPPGPAESPVIIPKTTKVLSDASRTSLQSYDPTTGELSFGPNADFGTLKAGDVLVTQPLPPLAPYGFLRKVVSVATVGQDTVVQTVPGKLTEAIYQGNFQLKQELKPVMMSGFTPLAKGLSLQSTALSPQFTFKMDHVVVYDADGNTKTTGDQVIASGSFTLDPVLDVSGGMHYDFPFSVQTRFHFAVGLNQHADVKVTADVQQTVHKEKQLASISFSPFTIWIGPVPLVFVPKLVVYAAFDGSLSATLTFTASENLKLLAGTDKPYGKGFHDISTASLTGTSNASSLHFDPPGLTFTMQPSLGARYQLLLYDLAGPQATLDAYVLFKGTIPGNPAWQVFAGIQGKLGLHVDVINANWDKTIFDKSILIAQETTNTPPELAPSDVNPSDGSSVQLGVPVQFNVAARDVEDGLITSGTWTVNGSPLTLDANGRHTFATAGDRTITVTVKDSAGATATTSITLHVLDTPPVATLVHPTGSDDLYAGSSLPALQGFATDANEPGGTLDCTRATWSISGPTAMPPGSMPANVCLSNTSIPMQSVTFPMAGSYTVTLTATDPQGKTDSKTSTVNVQPAPTSWTPSVYINAPVPGQSYGDSESVTLEATITDPDSTVLTYKWYLSKLYFLGSGPAGTVIVSNSVTKASSEASKTVTDTYPALGCSGQGDPYTLFLVASDGTHTSKVKKVYISCSFIPR